MHAISNFLLTQSKLMYMRNDNFEKIGLTMHKCFLNILGRGVVIGAKRLKAADTTQPFGKPLPAAILIQDLMSLAF